MGSSTTTRNFGMRRFTNLVREGRFRAPASTNLRLGIGVEIDPSDKTRVREITGGADLGGGGIVGKLVGVLWYEHDSQTFNDEQWGRDASGLPQDLDYAPKGRMVQVLHGPGAKVWFRNTEASTTEPGLNFANTRAAVTMIQDFANVDVGELLAWDDQNHAWAVTTVLDEAVFRVTYKDATLKTIDAEFLR